MIQVKIFYSIRKEANNKASLQLFADEISAQTDQKLHGLYNSWSSPCIGHFIIEQDGGASYIDAIKTREEYISELKERLKTDIPLAERVIIEDAIKNLVR